MIASFPTSAIRLRYLIIIVVPLQESYTVYFKKYIIFIITRFNEILLEAQIYCKFSNLTVYVFEGLYQKKDTAHFEFKLAYDTYKRHMKRLIYIEKIFLKYIFVDLKQM